MGLHGLGVICERLKVPSAVVSPDMPAALVQQGTTPMQRGLQRDVGTRPALHRNGAAANLEPPLTLLIARRRW